jgi:hypothetical protein
MTTVTQHPTSSASGAKLIGFLILAMGLVSVAMLFLSDGFGPRSIPPDGSLYTFQNWLQAGAIVVSGILLVAPNTATRTRWLAGGVALASAGLLLGSAIVAVKHWRPYGGMGIGYERTSEMQTLSAIAGTAALIAAVSALAWLHRSGALPAATTRLSRVVAVIGGGVMIVVIAPLVGIGSSETMDATSLGAFALIYALPWGVGLAFTAFLNGQATMGVFAVIIASTVCTIALPPMPDLVFGTAVPAGVLGLAIASLAFVIRLRDPDIQPR